MGKRSGFSASIQCPAYVEVDPSTSEITNVLVPLSFGVENIAPFMDDRKIKLIISHGRNTSCAQQIPTFKGFLNFSKAHEPTKHLSRSLKRKNTISSTSGRYPEPRLRQRRTPPEQVWDPSTAVSVTMAQAQKMFDLVSPKICCPATVGASCIPFNYPGDGCWGRAHEMCRFTIAAGIIRTKSESSVIFAPFHT